MSKWGVKGEDEWVGRWRLDVLLFLVCVNQCKRAAGWPLFFLVPLGNRAMACDQGGANPHLKFRKLPFSLINDGCICGVLL